MHGRATVWAWERYPFPLPAVGRRAGPGSSCGQFGRTGPGVMVPLTSCSTQKRGPIPHLNSRAALMVGAWENWPESVTMGELSLCLVRAVLESWHGGIDANLDGVSTGEPVCLLPAAISRRGGPAPQLGKAGEQAPNGLCKGKLVG